MMQHIGLDKGLSIPDIAIVYRYLVSASTYSTHYKEVTGDRKTHWDRAFQGYRVGYPLTINQSKNHEAKLEASQAHEKDPNSTKRTMQDYSTKLSMYYRRRAYL